MPYPTDPAAFPRPASRRGFLKRLAAADHSLASHGEQAHKPAMTDRLEIELELEPLAEPPAAAKPKNSA